MMRLSASRNREVLLIFFNPECPYSMRLIPSLYAIEAKRMDEEPIPVIVTTGNAGANGRLFGGHHIASRVLLQEGFEVSTLYRVRGTPMGYPPRRQNSQQLIDRRGGPGIHAGGSEHRPCPRLNCSCAERRDNR